MATVAGGAVLHLRVPSPSSESARRRRMASIRCAGVATARSAGEVEEDPYRTLRLAPGATRGEVKKAFRRLVLRYHPDVVRRRDDGVDFQWINVAYQTVMGNLRAEESRLDHWRARYGLADEDLERYRRCLNDEDEDDWFADF
uniref:Uncharacterized protein n=1 Tax=Avena sativa TaxID=4498 RepID=A0ACD6A158_AVESA